MVTDRLVKGTEFSLLAASQLGRFATVWQARRVTESLSRDLARSSLLDVESYLVHLDLIGDPAGFRSRTEVHFRCQEGTSTFADLQAKRVRHIALNGQSLDVAVAYQDDRVELSELGARNVLIVEAEFDYAFPEGLDRIEEAGGGKVLYSRTRAASYSKTHSSGAARMFCCFDQPDLRASFEVSMTVPSGWHCGTNAPAVAGFADETDAARTWHFLPSPPLGPSLLGLWAGHYASVILRHTRRDGSSLEVGLLGLPSQADLLASDPLQQVIFRSFDFFERRLGVAYPFEHCNVVFVPRFASLATGMPGLLTVQDQVLARCRDDAEMLYVAGVLTHELAHGWFGGLVDLLSEDDQWLTEALTTYVGRAALAEVVPGADPWDPLNVAAAS